MSNLTEWNPYDATFYQRHTYSVERGFPVLPTIRNLMDAYFLSFCKSVISAVTRDHYKHLTKDECSLNLKEFGGKDVETQDRHHEVILELLARKGVQPVDGNENDKTQDTVRY